MTNLHVSHNTTTGVCFSDVSQIADVESSHLGGDGIVLTATFSKGNFHIAKTKANSNGGAGITSPEGFFFMSDIEASHNALAGITIGNSDSANWLSNIKTVDNLFGIHIWCPSFLVFSPRMSPREVSC